VNEELLKPGLAWHYKRYDKNPAWADMEVSARWERKDCGVKADAMAPWEWRKIKK
jgi:hypothetical protein